MNNPNTSSIKRIRRPVRRTSSNNPPEYVGMLVASLFLAVICWLAAYQLVMTRLPRISGDLWLFFLLLQIAITTTVLPIVRYLNVRFTSMDRPVPAVGVIVRQSVWVGLFVVTCIWLQIPRALSLPIMILIGTLFIALEVFIRSREISSSRYDV
ncbi:hypothetical protein MASR2M15_17440 [Anaerolineales bacterium]